MRVLLFSGILFLSLISFVEGSAGWVDFCKKQQSLLAAMPSVDMSAIAGEAVWLGEGGRTIRVGGEVIDLSELARAYSDGKEFPYIVSGRYGGRIYIDVYSENIKNTFDYLTHHSADELLLWYLSKSDVKRFGERMTLLGSTSVTFRILASQIDLGLIGCEKSSMSEDLKNIVILLFKAVPCNFSFYKRFEAQGVKGVIFGREQNGKMSAEVFYELDQKYGVRLVYMVPSERFLNEEFYSGVLGGDKKVQ